jgi:hypothetical protein
MSNKDPLEALKNLQDSLYSKGITNRNVSERTIFSFNMLMHTILILTIVGGFYFSYVVKLSSDSLKNELEKILKEGVDSGMSKISNLNDYKSFLSLDMLNKLLIKYDKDTISDEYKVTNKFLRQSTIAAVFFLIITFILLAMSIKMNCGKGISFKHILLENISVFAFVGIIEISFFMIVAKNYIPIKPSLLSKSVLESLKNNLN